MRIYNGLVLMRPNATGSDADKAEAIAATQAWYKAQFNASETVEDEWLMAVVARFVPKIADTAFNRNWYGRDWVALPNRYFVQLAGPVV